MIRSEKGVSAVEFALIAPLLFVLTFAIVEFGLLLFDKAVVTNASREGGRAAIVYRFDGTDPDPLDESEIEEIVTAYANGYLVNLGGDNNLTDGDIDVGYSDDSNGPWGAGPPDSGDYVRVTVNYAYDFLVFPDLTRLIGGSFDGTINLIGTTIMRME